MKATGIIVEYNPLHNGHIHHINETKKQSGCDVLIAVMSSHFTQRGEPTIVDKFTRTKWALSAGVDLVVELPFVLGVQNADRFAFNSVSLLNALQVEDIYFGSESDNISHLEKIANAIDSQNYQTKLKQYLSEGYSYPTASNNALKEILGDSNYHFPNDILGVQYIKAGKKLKANIQFHTIKRVKSGYHEEINRKTDIQSASGIRKALQKNEEINFYTSSFVANDLKNKKHVYIDDFTISLNTIISRSTTIDLAQIHHVTEGLEHRFHLQTKYQSVQSFIDTIITKRYTISKLQRMIAFILVGVTKEEMKQYHPSYIRILGMSPKGQQYLNVIKRDIPLPLYTKIKEGLHPMLDVELRVSKLYSIAYNEDIFRREFKPVIQLVF